MTTFILPTFERICLHAGLALFCTGLEVLVAYIIRKPFRPSTSLRVYVAVQIANLFLCENLRALVSLVYILWVLFGSRIPWDKMKKKIGSTISSLTEVAKASIQRQQAEAFS